MAINYDYIFEVLRRFENGGRPGLSKGYVPKSNGLVIGNSGVTIGTGVDLGQQSVASLQSMSVSAQLIGTLKPYLGLKREAALNKLNQIPLYVSKDAVDHLDQAVMTSYIHKVRDNFDYDSRCLRSFGDCPKQVQAVVSSLAYHFGVSGKGFPSTWSKLVSGDYRAAVEELEDPACWNGKYMSRRYGEAAFLRELF